MRIYDSGKGRLRDDRWNAWRNMRRRCFDRDSPGYRNYGARGVTVCERWRDSFEAFCADMGPKPLPNYTLERINNNGNYEPGNCEWATPTKQARNRRNARLTFDAAKAVASRMLKGEPARLVAADFQISESLPREILKGRTWKDALAAARLDADSRPPSTTRRAP